MLATNLSEAESTETKLRMAFRLYDKDSSGDDPEMMNNMVMMMDFMTRTHLVMIQIMMISDFITSHGLNVCGRG